MAAAARPARSGRPRPRSRPDSSTVLVSSSTNSGTPSVLATICSSTSARQRLAAGDALDHRRALAPAETAERERGRRGRSRSRAARTPAGRSPSAAPADAGSDRRPARAARARSGRSSARPRAPSAPAAARRGRRAAPSSASKVRSFCRCGMRFERRVARSPVGIESSAASSGATSAMVSVDCGEQRLELVELDLGGSSAPKPAARSSWPMTG